ncbi:unnamed protein product, partial [Iphiclides podalirius]
MHAHQRQYNIKELKNLSHFDSTQTLQCDKSVRPYTSLPTLAGARTVSTTDAPATVYVPPSAAPVPPGQTSRA